MYVVTAQSRPSGGVTTSVIEHEKKRRWRFDRFTKFVVDLDPEIAA
jgi:hypothetical protein